MTSRTLWGSNWVNGEPLNTATDSHGAHRLHRPPCTNPTTSPAERFHAPSNPHQGISLSGLMETNIYLSYHTQVNRIRRIATLEILCSDMFYLVATCFTQLAFSTLNAINVMLHSPRTLDVPLHVRVSRVCWGDLSSFWNCENASGAPLTPRRNGKIDGFELCPWWDSTGQVIHNDKIGVLLSVIVPATNRLHLY